MAIRGSIMPEPLAIPPTRKRPAAVVTSTAFKKLGETQAKIFGVPDLPLLSAVYRNTDRPAEEVAVLQELARRDGDGLHDGGGVVGVGQPADLMPRFLARLIDFVLLAVFNGVLVSFLVVGLMLGSDAGSLTGWGVPNGTEYAASAISTVATAVITLAYFTLMESSRGQTIGKMLLKLETRGPGGGRPTFEQALKRNAFTAINVLGLSVGMAMLAGLVIGWWVLLPILTAGARGAFGARRLHFKREAAACVVLASPGYPGSARTGDPIGGLDSAALLPGVQIFHAGTAQRDGEIVSAGGRVLNVCATGAQLVDALKRAYQAAALVDWPGKVYRKDIGRRVLTHAASGSQTVTGG